MQAEFKIELHVKDLHLLENIHKYFEGKGQILVKSDKCIFRVRSLKDLELVIRHFDNYPLITDKRADYILFKSVYLLMVAKEHLTLEGLLKILSLKASINLGLPEKLKESFPNISPSPRPVD